MKTASIEFIAFDAQDVIATSGGPELWAQGGTLYSIAAIPVTTTVGYFEEGAHFTAFWMDGSDAGGYEDPTWYHIGTNYAIGDGKLFLTNLGDLGDGTPGAGENITKVGTVSSAEALQAIADWLTANGTRVPA